MACTIVTIWPREFLIRASFNRVDEMLREKCVRWLAASVLALPRWFFPSPIKLSPVESHRKSGLGIHTSAPFRARMELWRGTSEA